MHLENIAKLNIFESQGHCKWSFVHLNVNTNLCSWIITPRITTHFFMSLCLISKGFHLFSLFSLPLWMTVSGCLLSLFTCRTTLIKTEWCWSAICVCSSKPFSSYWVFWNVNPCAPNYFIKQKFLSIFPVYERSPCDNSPLISLYSAPMCVERILSDNLLRDECDFELNSLLICTVWWYVHPGD